MPSLRVEVTEKRSGVIRTKKLREGACRVGTQTSEEEVLVLLSLIEHDVAGFWSVKKTSTRNWNQLPLPG